jgi:hypothetical protein
MPHGHQPAHNHARTTQCLNLHALGEQWIEEVTDVDIVQTPPEECLEGEHLKFKAHIRGWKARTRKERCQDLLVKADHNLRQALLRPLWKDVLLIPRDWYPEHQPRYETKGWWYVPAEEVLGRACKSCNAFCETADFVGAKRRREVSVRCYKCVCVCLLLQYLIQSCARGGRRIVEDMCYEIRRANLRKIGQAHQEGGSKRKMPHAKGPQ